MWMRTVEIQQAAGKKNHLLCAERTKERTEIPMDRVKMEQTRQWVRDELDRCAAFWLEHGMDREHGGVYTCLDRTGEIYSTDKSVWMQGRCGWIFAFLCHTYGVKEEWLEASRSCLDFMEEHCINRAAGGRMYFTVTGDGRPLRQRRYYFSEAFYALANAEYYGVTGEAVRLERARRAYDLYWDLGHGMADPTGLGPKTIPETRQGRSFGGPMIILNVTGVMLRVDPERKELYEQRAQQCVDEMFQYHAKRTGDKALVDKAAQIFDWAIGMGWDHEYGGLLYFTDCLGKPPEAYEHDMKLWWPHNEILIASSMLYRDTGEEKYLDWFYKTVDYCKAHFADPEYGEWYGYLRRDGLPTMPSTKGSTFKGPFHVPRSLILVDGILGELLEK